VRPQRRDPPQIEIEVAGLEHRESLAVGLKHRVLDGVVDHLRVVPGPGAPDVRVALRGGEGLEDRLDLPEVLGLAADHQTIA